MEGNSPIYFVTGTPREPGLYLCWVESKGDWDTFHHCGVYYYDHTGWRCRGVVKGYHPFPLPMPDTEVKLFEGRR
jgi:hypothetical protein